jgi:hypothetical protein
MSPYIQVGSKWKVLPTTRNTKKNSLRIHRVVEVTFVDMEYVSIYNYGHNEIPETLELKVPLNLWGINFGIYALSNGQRGQSSHFTKLYV